jgi:hypothetical protein
VHQFQEMTLLKAGLLCKRISGIDAHFCVGLGRERPVGAVAPSSSSSTSATVRQQTNPNRLWQAAMLTLDAAAVEAPAHLDRLAGDVRAHQTETPQLRGRNTTCPLTPISRNCDSKNRETADWNSGEPTTLASSGRSGLSKPSVGSVKESTAFEFMRSRPNTQSTSASVQSQDGRPTLG